MSKIGSEPELRDFEDYDTLSGEKKKIVWTVIVVGILIGTAFFVAGKVYNGSSEALQVQDTIGVVPGSKSIPVK